LQVTNHLNLPQPVVDAVKNDEYDRGDADISVTELLSPPRQAALRRHFKDQIIVDASDEIYALFGKVGHGILEAADYTGMAETRLFAPMAGWTISGKTDSAYMEKNPGGFTLDDYKFTSPWVVKIHMSGDKGSRVLDWFKQLNTYRWLWQQNGLDVTRCRLVLLMSGWSKLEAKRSADYPQKQVMVIEVPIEDLNITARKVEKLVKMHQNAQQHLDVHGQEGLVRCNHDETWFREGAVAVMKKGRKSALRVLPNELTALDWCAANDYAVTLKSSDKDLGTVELKPGISLEKRPDDPVRCANYCDVAPFCQQYQEAYGEPPEEAVETDG